MWRADPESLRSFEELSTPVWVFDLDDELPHWANPTTLGLFNAPDVETLRERLHREPVSKGTKRRLAGYRDAFSRGETVTEEWTFYPEGKAPMLCRCTCSAVTIPTEGGSHLGALFEGQLIESQLGANERRLVEALRHCNELISLHAVDGQMITRNPAALHAFGTRSLGEVFARQEHHERATSVAQEEPLIRADVPMRTRQGERWYDTQIQRIQDPVSGEDAILMVQHDISRVRGTLAALQSARDEAEELRREAESASRSKSVFLATMSHELRTPMTGVLAAAELLRDSGLDPDQREALEMVAQGGRQMVALIDDVLHVARDELGDAEPTIERVELAALLEATLRPLAVAAEDKGLRLTWELDARVPSAISTDARRLRQILTNLVANAIRYTDEGRVEVSLRADGGSLRLEVSDTGIGVAESDVEQLFEAFHQGTSGRGGTGLGLHIARTLARALGGAIGARGQRGEGATFWATVPLLAAPERAPVQRNRSATPLSLRVLVVDDNALNRRAFRRMLRRWGCEVDEAGDGVEALSQLGAEGSVDAVLMDVNMPRMDGVTATRTIRERFGRRLPVIALTADTLQRDDGIFDGLLYKPVDWERLHAILAGVSEARA